MSCPDGADAECKKLQVFEIMSALAAIKLLRRHADGAFQWNSIEDCANFLGEKSPSEGFSAPPPDVRCFQGFFRALIGLLRDRKEVALSQLRLAFAAEHPVLRNRPFLSRRISLALKLLTFLGFARVVWGVRRQQSVVFQSSGNVRNAIVGFLQNAHFTAKADKKELKERFELNTLKSEAEKFVDRRRILRESGPLFKPRTASFDLNAIDKFMQKNQNIVVPNTPLVLKRRPRRKDTTHN